MPKASAPMAATVSATATVLLPFLQQWLLGLRRRLQRRVPDALCPATDRAVCSSKRTRHLRGHSQGTADGRRCPTAGLPRATHLLRLLQVQVQLSSAIAYQEARPVAPTIQCFTRSTGFFLFQIKKTGCKQMFAPGRGVHCSSRDYFTTPPAGDVFAAGVDVVGLCGSVRMVADCC